MSIIAVDKFADCNLMILGFPAPDGFAITPHDINELSFVPRGVWVGQGGDVQYIPKNGSTPLLLKNVADGTLLPIRPKKIMSGTTAQFLVGLY